MMDQFNLDVDKATRIWAEYESTHDLSGKQHLAVGIDPDSGEIHFGESAKDITLRLVREGRNKPLFFRWVNSPYYTRKGGRK
jgi:hypothetical protein